LCPVMASRVKIDAPIDRCSMTSEGSPVRGPPVRGSPARGPPVIYLDFQKAFDKVPHERLLKKIKAHGVTTHW
jgi:hypothetical protein